MGEDRWHVFHFTRRDHGVGFSRITLRQDYERDLWDLFIDGKLAAANLAFEGRGANLDNLRIYGSMAGDTFVDDLSARPDNMLFPDKDKDGLPDGWEIANGSNPNSYDRDALKPGTDKSFLDLYMDSLWPGGLNGSRTFPPGGEIPPLTIPAAHQPVTSLKGALSVGSDGSGTYSVPIDLPVGSGGMVPQISLNYSSNSGNGPVGLGWSVGGFQSITRGAATSGKDGFAGAVRFNGDDRFFFNGERLVCVKGIYGGKDSEYRTEIDSFARIRLFGGNQNSPVSWWQVETKAGLIIELGNAPDARVLAPDAKGPVSWDVSRVRDTVGNYYLVKWAGNTTADNLNLPDRRLERVSYTGNIRKSLSPYCHVDFEYESRPDKRTGYTPSGTYFEAGKRLKGIKVNTNGLVNHTYHLKYKQSAQSNRSLLTSIGKSHGNNGTNAVAETTFDWQGLKAGEAKWGKAEQTTLLKYNLNKLDADTALINSVVTTDSTRIRLDGDVARVHTLDAPVSIVPGSFVEFSVKAGKLDNGAYLIFDNNDVYEGINGQFAIRIKPPNAPDAAIPPRRQVIYPADSEGSVTYRIAFQGDPYKPFNYTSGTFTKIALVNYDNNIGNGTGFVEFNNIRVGTAKELDSNSVAPIVFPETNDIPRFTDNKGNQRGNIILDVDADGLPDISDFRVKYYGDSTLKPVAERQPVGKVYRNTGGGFQMDAAMTPPVSAPLTDNGDSGQWGYRHDMLAIPCDINSDGNMDLLVTDLFRGYDPVYTSIHTYQFIIYKDNKWKWLDDGKYDFPFHSRNNSSAGKHGGKKHLIAKRFVDVDNDGYLDFIVSTTKEGWLAPLSNHVYPPKILPERSTTVFLNKFHLGGGWQRDDSLALPLSLGKSTGNVIEDAGSRLVDIDGDGFMDQIGSTYTWGANTSWFNHRAARKMFPGGSTGGKLSWIDASKSPLSQDRPSAWTPSAAYPHPSAMEWRSYTDTISVPALVTGNAVFADEDEKTVPTRLIDLNGDGLVDLHRSSASFFSHVLQPAKFQWTSDRVEIALGSWLNTGRETSAGFSRWTTGSGSSGPYALPLCTSVSGRKSAQNRAEFADLNADGLPDILFSMEGNQYLGAGGYRMTRPEDPFGGSNNGAFINTGTGWAQDTSWGLPPGIRLGKQDATIPAAIVADMNGDGFPDVIGKILDGQQPELWLNQCKPEVITSITDGFRSTLLVEYQRLNDPSPTIGFKSRVFEKYTGMPIDGIVNVMDSRLVVSRYSDENGVGGRNWKSQRYGDLRYDRVNESSLGFGWVEALDENNGQLTRTDFRRDYPFAGSPVSSASYVRVDPGDIADLKSNTTIGPGMKLLYVETAFYEEMPAQSGIGGKIRRPVQTFSAKQLFDLDLTLKSLVITSQPVKSFDEYGFVGNSLVGTGDGTTVKTENHYNHIVNSSSWLLGRLNRSTVTKSGKAAAGTVKTSTFGYDPVTGLLNSETMEPGDTRALRTTYLHDDFGNVNVTTLSPADADGRTHTTNFDPTGRFLVEEKNDHGHRSIYKYDEARALLTSTTSATGLVTSYGYDSFGTRIMTEHPDGTRTAEITGYAANGALPGWVTAHTSGSIRFFRATESSGTPVAKVYLDTLGRELVTETTILRNAGSDGPGRYSKVYIATKYDNHGRKTAVTGPFAEGDVANTTFIRYDILGRTVETIRPGGACDHIEAQGYQDIDNQPTTYSRTVNAANQRLERWEDQHGRLIQSRDSSGQTTKFTYDVEGRLVETHMDGLLLLKNTFDIFGNKTEVMEANSGTSRSTYNSYGEMLTSTNARNQTTTYRYDTLGRTVSVAKPEGTYHTLYYTPGMAREALGLPWKTFAASTGATAYSEEAFYDDFGRIIRTETARSGERFTTHATYDALGRVSSSTDAGGLSVFNEYDSSFSFPVRRVLAPGGYEGAGTVLWQAGTFDSNGRVLKEYLAQGVDSTRTYDQQTGDLLSLTTNGPNGPLQKKRYVWKDDATGAAKYAGNLLQRADDLKGTVENFGYDGLNRLRSAGSRTFDYDEKGNLKTKGADTLSYGGSRPHAVSSAVVKGFSRNYAYDEGGYVTSDGKRSYEWTSHGQLSKLVYPVAPELRDFTGGLIHGASEVESVFMFDSGGNRARQIKQRIAANDSRTIEDTLYLGTYERETHTSRESGTGAHMPVKILHRHSLGGGIVYTRQSGGGDAGVKLTTVLADHLGSTDAVLVGIWTGTSFTGQTTEFQSFDAWGERRDPATLASYRTSDGDPFRSSGRNHDRGYTGHEQLDDSGLIHMNGRIYDPELGRFLSPDPYVQIPEYSQNFNRYSYVLNNPLNATDPSGFSFISNIFHKIGSWVRENWRTIVVIVVVAVLTLTPGGQAFAGAIASTLLPGAVAAGGIAATAATGAVIGSIAGGLGAALNGGSIGDILRGAAIGGIQGAITGGVLHGMEASALSFAEKTAHVAGHGIVGGAANVAMGGKFQDGFLSAAAAAYAGWTVLKNTTIARSIGSTGTGRTIISGVVGGTVSAIGGGKFANGAYTASFQHLLNAELERLFEGSPKHHQNSKGDVAPPPSGDAQAKLNHSLGVEGGSRVHVDRATGK